MERSCSPIHSSFILRWARPSPVSLLFSLLSLETRTTASQNSSCKFVLQSCRGIHLPSAMPFFRFLALFPRLFLSLPSSVLLMQHQVDLGKAFLHPAPQTEAAHQRRYVTMGGAPTRRTGETSAAYGEKKNGTTLPQHLGTTLPQHQAPKSTAARLTSRTLRIA